MNKNLLGMILSACLIIIPNLSNAASINATNKATATLASSCVMNVPNVPVGDVTATGTTFNYVIANANINVTCSKGIVYAISMGNGANNVSGTRNMIGSSHSQLVKYSPCMVNTLDGTGQCSNGYWGLDPAHMLNGVGTGAVQSQPLYIFVLQGYYAPDNYADTMTAGLTF